MEIIFFYHIVSIKPIYQLVIVHIVIIGDLIDDLRHHQVERRECHHQAQQVQEGRDREAFCKIEDILEHLCHRQ